MIPRRTLSLACVAAAALAATLVASPSTAGPSQSPEPGQDRAAPRQSPRAYGLTVTGKLVRFRLNDPAGAVVVDTIGDLGPDDYLVGIDMRPQGKTLYGVGNDSGVFTVNKTTAAPTRVGAIEAPLTGTHFGLDVDPVENEIRVVSNAGQNVSYDPVSGDTTVDHLLNYNGTTGRGSVGLAYTNSDVDGSTGTRPFVVDVRGDELARLSHEGNGTLLTIGGLGVDAKGDAGFDALGANRGYATLTIGTSSALYTINLTTGHASLVGAFPTTMKVVDLAIPVP